MLVVRFAGPGCYQHSRSGEFDAFAALGESGMRGTSNSIIVDSAP